MEIEALRGLYRRSAQYKTLTEWLENNRKKNIFLDGLLSSSAPLLFSCIENPIPFLIIMNDEEAAGYFYHDLSQILGTEKVLFSPSSYRNSRKYSQKDAANEILRTEVLTHLSSHEGDEPLFIVTHPAAIEEQVVSQQKLKENTLQLTVGDTIDINFIEETLESFGFEEVDYVYEPGQFAIRGSIVDVFSFSCEYPYRVDFFGDDIDSIRTFDVQTQLSRMRVDKVEIVSNLFDSTEELIPFVEVLPEDTVIVMKNKTFVCDSIEEESFLHRLPDFRTIELHAPKSQRQSSSVVDFNITAQPLFHKNFELLISSLEDYITKGYRLYILADSTKQQQRLKEIFEDKSRFITFTPVNKTLHEGFADNELKACFFTDHQIFDRFHKFNLRSEKARSGKIALSLKELQQFEYGDLIVHVDHGIGRFEGLVRLPQGDGYQEMIKIAYQNSDTIYVSIHSLYKVSKYRGKEGAENVRLSRLGTGAWQAMKERTKKKIKDIARDLILLYAKRRKEKGFAFSPDSFMQNELEASFLYEDTPDQLKATNDVKSDMEKPIPMDRLVCGDVGFGKTEVAVRAAFKAACDSKQVAVLVPTTVLAYQHYQTFSERLKGMPVRVDYISRARSASKTKSILSDLAEGKIDIIVGTHKLLGKTIKFHDLGLLIIDEEQKFGVASKEKLRQIRSNVDTLTMSATPIPRTLQFSLMGARDMSVIQTPPPNRHPIQTEVHTFDKELITDAINFELSRNGQVFFVSNRITSLDELYYLIKRNIPDARVAIGHGQMKPEELEQIVMGFVNYDYDVLLSTTIVENGIDIPNANTIIINNAQNFGLSDLHQMRGRVGRGDKKAYCYLLAPPLSALPNDARKRLEAIENFSDLGSGIHLAMQDLDIRGAGNLLGAEQSGFIADLGYETYQKILKEAITEIRNEGALNPSSSPTGGGREGASLNLEPETLNSFGEPGTRNQKPEARNQNPSSSPTGGGREGAFFVSDCSIDSDLEIYFPDSFVPNSSERMLLYRELDSISADDELDRFRTRLIDRFGKIPPEAESLMKVVVLRRIAKEKGVEHLVLKQGRMNMYLVSNENSPYYRSEAFDSLLHFITQNVARCNIREVKGKRIITVSKVPSVEEAINVLKAI